MPQAPRIPEQWVDVSWPYKGVDNSIGKERQPDLTCLDALNVRGFDTEFHIFRGAQRQGLSDHLNAAINSTNAIQCLDSVFQSSTAVSGGLDTRKIQGVVVSNGTVKSWEVGVGGPVAVTNGAAALAANTTPVIFSAEHTGAVYFADGASSKLYTASTNAITAWSPSAGTLPANAAERCRLICTWRGRIVMAGLRGDEHNWFMSAVGAPLDWDYSPATTVETQAVAGNNAFAGKVPDIINSLVPLSDDVLLFGGDHSLWQLTGDPMAGGRIDLLSDITGMAWGRPWCKDSQGTLYFVGTRGGVFKLSKGSTQIERISQSIDSTFNILAFAFNSATTIIRMAWDEVQQGFFLWKTPTGGGAATNYFYDARMQAFWPEQYVNPLHNPRTVMILDGDNPNDRCVLLGCQDSRVRQIDLSVNTDDGYAISSYVLLGPIKGGKFAAMLMKEMQAVLNLDTDGAHDNVTWSLYAGHSAQDALFTQLHHAVAQVNIADKDPVMTGTWKVGRNRSTLVRRSGHEFYIKIAHSTLNKTWALENLMVKLRSLGMVRQRALT